MSDKLIMTSVIDLLWADEENSWTPIDDKPVLRLDCAGDEGFWPTLSSELYCPMQNLLVSADYVCTN